MKNILNWNGIEWSEQEMPERLNVIFARTANDVIAAGENIWQWNGINWKNISTESSVFSDLSAIEIPWYKENPWNPFKELTLFDSSGEFYYFHMPK